MLRVIEPVEISFVAAETPATVRKEILQTLASRGGRVKVDDDATILAGFGSNLKVRLLGAWIAGIKAMPRDVLVQMKGSSGQTQVLVTVRDTLGFGSRAGISEQLQKLMYDDALSLKALFSARRAD